MVSQEQGFRHSPELLTSDPRWDFRQPACKGGWEPAVGVGLRTADRGLRCATQPTLSRERPLLPWTLLLLLTIGSLTHPGGTYHQSGARLEAGSSTGHPASTGPFCLEGDADSGHGRAACQVRWRTRGGSLGIQRTCVSLDVDIKGSTLEDGASPSNGGGGEAGRTSHAGGTACLK